MKKINDYFDKFKDITNHSLVIRGAAKEVLEKKFFIKIKEESLSLKNGVLKIKIHGPAKLEIITQEKKIIKEINNLLGKEAVVKIT